MLAGILKRADVSDLLRDHIVHESRKAVLSRLAAEVNVLALEAAGDVVTDAHQEPRLRQRLEHIAAGQHEAHADMRDEFQLLAAAHRVVVGLACRVQRSHGAERQTPRRVVGGDDRLPVPDHAVDGVTRKTHVAVDPKHPVRARVERHLRQLLPLVEDERALEHQRSDLVAPMVADEVTHQVRQIKGEGCVDLIAGGRADRQVHYGASSTSTIWK